MWRTVAVALLLVQLVGAVRFGTLLGKWSDPCAYDLYGIQINSDGGLLTSARNCILAGKPTTVPQSSATILIPSENPAYADGLIVTLTGSGFEAFRPAGVPTPDFGFPLFFALGNPTADPAEYCTTAGTAPNLDAASPVAPGQVLSDTQILINIPMQGVNNWGSRALELENLPRPICAILPVLGSNVPVQPVVGPGILANAVWTGFFSGAVFDCNDSDRLCGSRDLTALGLSQVEISELRARTQCCRRVTPLTILVGTVLAPVPQVPVEITGFAPGHCINPNVQSCCGGSAVERTQEKCCSNDLETTQFIDGACQCTIDGDCEANGETLCCRATRYDLVREGEALDPLVARLGQCYNPQFHRCCESGQRYDPGSLQCCPINGLQTQDVPCPCNSDFDCAGISATANMRCCRQATPTPLESSARCTAWTNFPLAGPLPPQATRCLGTCYDTRFGICCNGAQCTKGVETCCNNTCCNRFTQGCFRSRQAAIPGFASNPREFGVIFARCSAIEHLDSVRVFWFAILPAILLAASFIGLALALVFVNKASARRHSFLERALIVLAVITFFLALPLYFAPVYKYGIVVAFASILAIITAGVRVRWLNVFAIIFLAIAVIYVIDPFWGNAWLTLASNRHYYGGSNGNGGFANPFIVGTSDTRTSGVLHTSDSLHDDRDGRISPTLRRCITFYDYFVVDPQLYDFTRIDNPEIETFGYCSRAWIIGQLYIEGLIILFLLVTFILALLALIVRFRKLRFEPIELEVRGVEPGIVY